MVVSQDMAQAQAHTHLCHPRDIGERWSPSTGRALPPVSPRDSSERRGTWTGLRASRLGPAPRWRRNRSQVTAYVGQAAGRPTHVPGGYRAINV